MNKLYAVQKPTVARMPSHEPKRKGGWYVWRNLDSSGYAEYLARETGKWFCPGAPVGTWEDGHIFRTRKEARRALKLERLK